MLTVIPYLTVKNAHEAIDFYARAFGAEPQGSMDGPDGLVMHGVIRVGESPIFLTDERLEYGVKGAGALGGSPVTIHLQTDDADAVWNRATEAGCTVTMPLELQFWGDRYGTLTDPYGHSWAVCQTVEERSREQILAAMAEMSPEGTSSETTEGAN